MILLLLCISCTNESSDISASADTRDTKVNQEKTQATSRSVQSILPANPANSYDIVGKLHNDILDSYLNGNYQGNTLTQISQQIESIATANTDFMLLNTDGNLTFDLQGIQEIINNPQAELTQAVENASMTVIAKESLSDFMSDIQLRKNDPYNDIFQFIVTYELWVSNHLALNNEDKRIMLTTSSIIRYSLYYSQDGKDDDWDTSVGHGAGGLTGALENSSNAIIRSLVTGIMIDNLTTGE